MARTPLYPVVATDFGEASAINELLAVSRNLPPARWLADQAPRIGGVLRELIGQPCDGDAGGS